MPDGFHGPAAGRGSRRGRAGAAHSFQRGRGRRAEKPVEIAAPASASSSSVTSGTSTVGEGSSSKPAIGMGSGKGILGRDVFVFLCPNGHKLNGPSSLKGKAGKCPHCGARFRIPTDDELEEEEEVPTGEADEEEVAEGQLNSESGGGFNFNFAGLSGQQQQEEEIVDGALEEQPLELPPPGPAALGYIFGRLWDRKVEGIEIEIFLTEGEIMSPDHFSEILSTSDYGVFAVKEGDGTYAITVIPWSTVRRIGMRKLTELPPNAFR